MHLPPLNPRPGEFGKIRYGGTYEMHMGMARPPKHGNSIRNREDKSKMLARMDMFRVIHTLTTAGGAALEASASFSGRR